MTPPPDPVAALAEALHRVWSRSGSEGATIEDEAEYLHERLTAAGWSLSHDSEQEALVAALDRERVLRDLLSPAERPGAGYPCRRCGRRDMGHEPSCWYTRVDAAIEGRP